MRAHEILSLESQIGAGVADAGVDPDLRTLGVPAVEGERRLAKIDHGHLRLDAVRLAGGQHVREHGIVRGAGDGDARLPRPGHGPGDAVQEKAGMKIGRGAEAEDAGVLPEAVIRGAGLAGARVAAAQSRREAACEGGAL